VAFWGFIRALQPNLNIYFTPQSAAPHLVLTDVRRLQRERRTVSVYLLKSNSSFGFPDPEPKTANLNKMRIQADPDPKLCFQTIICMIYTDVRRLQRERRTVSVYPMKSNPSFVFPDPEPELPSKIKCGLRRIRIRNCFQTIKLYLTLEPPKNYLFASFYM
jgi:hypothetical protein